MSKRSERVADSIRRELGDLFTRTLNDPRMSFVSVTAVEVSGDLAVAKVYLSSLEGSEKRQETLRAVQRATPFLRRELAGRLGLREVPELRFAYDESIERGARIEDLLRRIEHGEPLPDEEEHDSEPKPRDVLDEREERDRRDERP